ncbi:MAG: type II toxin-antitoxin system HicA family toxin [Solirubrobacterales bacterium]
MALSNHHRETVRKILSHPTSANIEWRQALSLLEAIGEVTEEHNGHFKVTVGPETETLHRPHGKDIDEQMVIDLRRMLVQAGYGDADPVPDSRDRDFGDDRWGKPE